MNKLILIDSDGTLNRSDGTISERTKEAIRKNLACGNKICIATGKPRYHSMKIKELSGASNIIISSNGSEIYDIKNDKVINATYINNDEIIKLIKYAYDYDLQLMITVDDMEYVTKKVENDMQKLLDKNYYIDHISDLRVKQCMFSDDRISIINDTKKLIKENNQLKIINEIRPDDDYKFKWFSISNKISSKGLALKQLASYLNIPLENTIAIGNDYNDVPMFLEAGMSVAVKNASDDIKKMANFVTESNNDDGVAKFLEQLCD